jgi:hypothetical protein
VTEKRKYTRLSESAWAEARALWEVGDSSLEELTKRFGVSKRALQFHFSKHALSKGSKSSELAAAVEMEVLRRELPDKEILVQRAKNIKERTYANSQAIENLVMAQLDLAKKDPSQAYKAASAMKMLSLAASTLERTHRLTKTALGLDKEPDIGKEFPVLTFRDLSQEDLEEIRAGHADKWGDDDVIDDPECERASDQDDDPDEEENDIIEIRPQEPEKHDEPEEAEDLAPIVEGCRLVRGA